MHRIGGSISTIGLCAALALLLAACGGASASGSGGSGPGGAAPGGEGAVDEQAEQAAKKCQSEIEKAVLQPPDALSKVQVNACLIGARPEWSKCSKGIARDLTLKIIVEKTGEVSSAFAVGEGADGPEAACVGEVVSGVAFPVFKGSPQQTLKYPFKIGQ
jgi:hypothetical protein